MNDKITEMFAFVCTDKDGSDGIPAVQTGHFLAPLLGTDMKRIDSVRPVAQALADDKGVAMKLVRFSQIEVLETLTPSPK